MINNGFNNQGYRWLTQLSLQFLEKDYLREGQTVDQRVNEICYAAEKILEKPGFAKAFKENFQKGWYSLSTPIWTNFGTDRGMPISCFGSYIDDTMQSILYTSSEVGMMSKCGGGTSAYFGNLRGRGEPIKNNGESSGAVHFAQLFNTMINIVSQGATRRGSFAAYLPIDHKDIEEFLTIKTEGSPIQDISFGVCIKDDWMQSMIDGNKEKRKIWAKVLECRTNVGYPYIIFIDTANKNTVDVYKDKKTEITHSNLCCVTGDQRVISDRGMLTAKELYEQGEELTLFDGNQTVKASEMRLIHKKSSVYKITLSNGMTHTVTSNHKIQTNLGMIRTDKLKIGDRVSTQIKKGIFGTVDMPDEAFLLGLYQADGTQHKDIIMIDIWEKDFDLIEEIEKKFESIFYKYGCDKYNIRNQFGDGVGIRNIKAPKFRDCIVSQSLVKKKRLASKTLKKALAFEKGYVPSWIWESNEKTQWQYIRGLYYADGTARIHHCPEKANPLYLSLSNNNKKFLEEIQILLANLGIKTSLSLMRKEGESLLPDGKGGYKIYISKDNYRLVTGNKNNAIVFEKNTGFLSRKKVTFDKEEYQDNTKKFNKIKSIEYLGKTEVYCPEVYTEEHKWVCNGFITHNSEILLPDSEDESFVCDLSSMNILYYDEWKNTNAVEILIYLLDATMSEFIQKAENIQFMERSVKFAKRHRALGMGWLGWHSYLQSKLIPWESLEAKSKNIEVAKTIQKQSYIASCKLAQEYGEPELLKGVGRRNTTTQAIAPTKSSSFILGQVSEGIEPARSNYYIKDLAKGKFSIKNPYLEKLLQEKDKDNEAIWQNILRNGGSVQHLDFLSDHEKAVFKTFAEISPKEIIIQAAARQKYIDQSQSLNLMIHPSIPIKDVNSLLIEAWRMGVKSLYYQFSENASQSFARQILNCTSCEA
jgi:ribonucleoside-diphosphate reductase alpha chain